MKPYYSAIVDTLKSVERPGLYATGGECPMPLPSLSINSTPEVILGLPLSKSQVKAIIDAATRAPFGRGEETIVDTSVRNTWQLNPTEFVIKNERWENHLQILVNKVKADLGCNINREVVCELYKLLLYEPGGFFKPHRDTEKSEGMFGTLIIQLPSNYSGGQLEVYHQSKSMQFNFDGPVGCSNFHYAAFYADCQHEIKPVTSGYRLCLVYNLVYRGSGKCPVPACNEEIVSTLVSSMREWDKDVEAPPIMAYFLEHQYCKKSLSFQSLKNKDRAVADILTLAKQEVEFDVYLGQVNVDQILLSEAYGFEMELDEESITAENLISYDDDKTISSMDLNKNYFVPKDFIDSRDRPDEETHHATGNEGVSTNYQYNWASLLIWPSKNRMSIIGVSNMMYMLEKRLLDPNTFAFSKEIALVKDILHEDFPVGPIDAQVSLLRSVQRLGDVELISKSLQAIASASSSATEYDDTLLVEDASFKEEVLNIGQKYGWNVLQPHLQTIFDHIFNIYGIHGIVEYLIFLKEIMSHQASKSLCQGLASSIVKVLSDTESDDNTKLKAVILLFQCLLTSECNEQLFSFLETILAKPTIYSVQKILVPAFEDLFSDESDNELLQQLLSYCISSLEASSSPCSAALSRLQSLIKKQEVSEPDPKKVKTMTV